MRNSADHYDFIIEKELFKRLVVKKVFKEVVYSKNPRVRIYGFKVSP